MQASTHTLAFNGGLLRRGFWLYVWEVQAPDGRKLHYVGRTGDNSTVNAQSPFNRMGQHLGFAPNSSMLRRHLKKFEIDPSTCNFRLISHGPIIAETKHADTHWKSRDTVAAMERALAESLTAAGYLIMNTVRSRVLLDEAHFATIRLAFAAEFPGLGTEPIVGN